MSWFGTVPLARGCAGARRPTLAVAMFAVAAAACAPTVAAAPAGQSRAPSFAVRGTLDGVTAISATDVWAVGAVGALDVASRPLIAHWNGMSWKRYPDPRPVGGALDGVAGVSDRDIWAVGSRGGSKPRILIERWNGTRWTLQRRAGSVGYGVLQAVAVASARDAWAVGQAGNDPLIMHWDGTSWRRAATPRLAGGDLFGVTAVSARDAWAVGYAGKQYLSGKALIEHWDGRSWRRVRVSLPAGISALIAVAAVSRRDAWAVGIAGNTTTLTLHWDGRTWRRVPSPCTRGCVLTAIMAISGTAAWAAGNGEQKTLTLRWNGTAWHRVRSPTRPQAVSCSVWPAAARASGRSAAPPATPPSA